MTGAVTFVQVFDSYIKEIPMMAKARCGRIAYLNVLPIYFALEHIFGENGFLLVRGTPAELNALMRRGEVDLGSISAMEYGRAFRDYLLLPDLSISSRGAVGSVLLFSRVPFSRLDGRTIRVSAASASGAALVKVLMAELFEVQPRYQTAQLADAPLADAAAVMAIGDEALRLKAAGALPFELDLGQAWQELTGLPFVFGVWAVRRNFAATQPEATAALHRLLLRSRDWGLVSLPELSRIAGPSFSMTPAQILAYFHQLNYSLDPEHEEGLAAFFHYLYNLGELTEEPELEYFNKEL
jgi:chorismate dehydratase